MKGYIKVWKELLLAAAGGSVYYCVELLYRGYSHPSMFVLGGICVCWIDYVEKRMGTLWTRGIRMFVSGLGITFFEFICGCIVNLWLGLDIWDYSDLHLQFLGQISFLFFGFWCLMSLPGSIFCKSFRCVFFDESF